MKIFDLEQEILDAWRVLDDVDLTLNYFVEDPKFEHMPADISDELMNKFMGIKELYELKFNKLWNTFEQHCKEYHSIRKSTEPVERSRSYILEIQENEHGQYIEIPQVELDALGWKEGDTLVWKDVGNGTWAICKPHV